jgi:COP9 signalosome complex subunit 3
MASEGSHSIDNVVDQITNSNNISALNHGIRHALPKEIRETVLASALSSGQDPLSVLDVRENTLGVLYIMQVFALCKMVIKCMLTF